MSIRRSLATLAFVLSGTVVWGADGPNKPKPWTNSLAIESVPKGRVKVVWRKQGGEATGLALSTLEDGSARLELDGKTVATADSFKLIIRDGSAKEIHLQGHVVVNGESTKISADDVTFYCEDAFVRRDTPAVQKPSH